MILDVFVWMVILDVFVWMRKRIWRMKFFVELEKEADLVDEEADLACNSKKLGEVGF